MNCIIKIKEAENSYTSTEKIIARYILNNTQEVLNQSAQSLGQVTKTSAAAVIRFSKKLGYKGFSELKMNLAQSQEKEDIEDIDIIIQGEDDIATLADKCCRLNMNTVLKTYQLINVDNLKKAIDYLINADTIYLFGVGGSAIVTNDFEQKLIRIGKKVIYNHDIHVQMTFVESMNENDIALFVSYSGMTNGLIDIARVIKERNVKIVSITQYTQNTIAKLSDVNLVVPCEEKKIRMGAISSRISSLVMTDLLYYGIFQNDLDGSIMKLVESKEYSSRL